MQPTPPPGDLMEMFEITRLLVIVSLVVLPALAVTARFAIKPIVEAILRLKEGGVLSGSDAALRDEVRRLREEVQQLQRGLAYLQDAEAFDRALGEAGRRPLPPLVSGTRGAADPTPPA